MGQQGAEAIPGFDEAFFADYEMQLADIGVAEQASAALAGILTVKAEDGMARSYTQIKAETEAFFSNPLILQDLAMVDRLALQYAHFCTEHAQAAETLNDGPLASVHEKGSQLQATGHGQRHDNTHSHLKDEKAKKKKKNKKAAGRMAYIFASRRD